MRADGAVGQVEPLPYLAVGQPLGGELDYLQLVGGQPVTGVRRPAAAGLTRGAQFPTGLLTPGDRAERVEHVAGRPEMVAGLDAAPPTP